MTRDKDEFFSKTGVQKSELSDLSIERMSKIRSALLSYLPNGSDSGVLTDIQRAIEAELDFNDIEEVFDANFSDYTLMACLADDGAAWTSDIIYSRMEVLERDIERNGIASIWRSIGIIDENQKKKVVSGLVEKVVWDLINSMASYHEPELSFNLVLAILNDNDWKMVSEDSVYYPLIDKELLFSSDADRAAAGYQCVQSFPDEQRAIILFTWLMPLCHRAYIDGRPHKDIIKGAQEILEGMAEAYGIEDAHCNELFKRRCLAHIAMGFSGLMMEIDFKKDDLKTLTYRDHEVFALTDMRYLKLSPIAELSTGDHIAVIYHDAFMLDDFGIELDIDILMDIESHKINKMDSALGAAADLNPDILLEAIEHPLWSEIEHIVLSTSHSKELPIDVQAAMIKRLTNGKHFTSSPAPRGPWGRSDQRYLLDYLVRENAAMMKGIDIIKPDSDILMKYRDKLPKEARRYAISNDLGI